MDSHNTTHCRQPQPRAILFGGKEGGKDMLDIFRWYAASGILNTDNRFFDGSIPFFVIYINGNTAIAIDRLNAVDDQIQDGILYLRGIDERNNGFLGGL